MTLFIAEIEIAMDADLIWLITKNRSSFLLKRNGIQLSAERNNLTNLNSFKYSGIANKKAIGVTGARGGKGIVISTKKNKVSERKPADKIHTVTLRRGVRRAAKSFTNSFTRAYYRPDLRKETLARISAIYESQKPIKQHAAKEGRRHTKGRSQPEEVSQQA
ncbi:4786_t:CDS:2 [Paraglomus brasilianum]|uniref:4786_t:CDS:1 n=1 Tax=Paraglomus brasilianum TaxID=144538 RepID=A0A9N9CQG8_9GLOM|nr:4786_t:CDS:2 [Paraglomus brasilianum]